MNPSVTTINGKTVKTGEKIVDFRGNESTFDYTEDDRIVTRERPFTRFVRRVFVDVKP